MNAEVAKSWLVALFEEGDARHHAFVRRGFLASHHLEALGQLDKLGYVRKCQEGFPWQLHGVRYRLTLRGAALRNGTGAQQG